MQFKEFISLHTILECFSNLESLWSLFNQRFSVPQRQQIPVLCFLLFLLQELSGKPRFTTHEFHGPVPNYTQYQHDVANQIFPSLLFCLYSKNVIQFDSELYSAWLLYFVNGRFNAYWTTIYHCNANYRNRLEWPGDIREESPIICRPTVMICYLPLSPKKQH